VNDDDDDCDYELKLMAKMFVLKPMIQLSLFCCSSCSL